jgi:pyruvate formate lyase activating enzyme
VKWISGTLGLDTVLHLSAYYPRYLSKEPPTPPATIHKLKDIASKYLNFVYAGNLSSERNETFCPGCHHLLINRIGYRVETPGVDENGSCKLCGNHIFENF